MIRVLLWGTGKNASIVERFLDTAIVDIVAIGTNEKELLGKTALINSTGKKVRVVGKDEVGNVDFDMIIIASKSYAVIKDQLISLGVDSNKIIRFNGEKENKELYNYMNAQWKMYSDDADGIIIEKTKLNIPKNHTLPKLKTFIPMYDEFLPCLAKIVERKMQNSEKLSNDYYIIDIGANVGDSAMEMIPYTSAQIVSVEADEDYYSYLSENSKSINAKYENRLDVVRGFVGSKSTGAVVMDHYLDGTARRKDDDNLGVNPITLKDIIDNKGIEISKIGLIKSDTDGYDYDAILSSPEIFENNSPLLYWENEFWTYEQFNKYTQMVETLNDRGYCCFFCFDNYGNYMGRMDCEGIHSIMENIMRAIRGYGMPTFEYIDVLSCKKEDVDCCKMGIDTYLMQFPLERFV